MRLSSYSTPASANARLCRRGGWEQAGAKRERSRDHSVVPWANVKNKREYGMRKGRRGVRTAHTRRGRGRQSRSAWPAGLGGGRMPHSSSATIHDFFFFAQDLNRRGGRARGGAAHPRPPSPRRTDRPRTRFLLSPGRSSWTSAAAARRPPRRWPAPRPPRWASFFAAAPFVVFGEGAEDKRRREGAIRRPVRRPGCPASRAPPGACVCRISAALQLLFPAPGLPLGCFG